jgi:nicotinate-nucleotide adenylyltransferase
MAGRVALFGGCFNPVHVGHLAAAEGVRDALGLDRVVFVPAGSPPHKVAEGLASASDRLAMLGLAMADNPGFGVWDYEVRRRVTSYTLHTVEAWKAANPDLGRPLFIIGGDTIGELTSWHRVRDLFAACDLTPVARPGFSLDASELLKAEAGEAAVAAMLARMVRLPLLDVSSTDLRRRIAEGRSVRYLIPRSVIAYIRDHGLYQSAGAPAERTDACRRTPRDA